MVLLQIKSETNLNHTTFTGRSTAVVRPYSAKISSLYNNGAFPASLAIDNDKSTYTEASYSDDASWLELEFSESIDLVVQSISLVSYKLVCR